MPALPLDVWLIVFDNISDPDILWSIVRNVSQHLRVCVDEHFRHSILHKTCLILLYSTIHTTSEPPYLFLYVPMRFTRLSEDDTRAVFQQAYFEGDAPVSGPGRNGSLRG